MQFQEINPAISLKSVVSTPASIEVQEAEHELFETHGERTLDLLSFASQVISETGLFPDANIARMKSVLALPRPFRASTMNYHRYLPEDVAIDPHTSDLKGIFTQHEVRSGSQRVLIIDAVSISGEIDSQLVTIDQMSQDHGLTRGISLLSLPSEWDQKDSLYQATALRLPLAEFEDSGFMETTSAASADSNGNIHLRSDSKASQDTYYAYRQVYQPIGNYVTGDTVRTAYASAGYSLEMLPLIVTQYAT